MLDRFPKEVLVQVTCYLNFYERLNVAKTCRLLKYMMYISTLYESIVIPPTRTSQVLKLFEEKQLDGAMVRYCYMDHCYVASTFLLKLPLLFPNMKKLSYLHESSSSSSLLRQNNVKPVRKLKDKFEVGKNWVAVSIWSLLSNCAFSNLRELDFDFSRVQNSGIKVHHGCYGLLKSVPALETLTFSYPKVDQDLLESLHKSNPRLVRLHIYDTTLDFDEEKMNKLGHLEIVTKLKTIRIACIGDINQNGDLFLEYIYRKYPALMHLDLYLGEETFESYIHNIKYGSSIRLLEQLTPQLQYLKLNFYMMERFISKNNIEYNISHMKGIGFHIPRVSPVNSYESIRSLLRIQAFKNIHTLLLPLNYSHHNHHKNTVLPQIKYLSLCDHTPCMRCNEVVNINDLFHTYPAVIDLKINSTHTKIISANSGKSKSLTYSSLRSLDFSVMEMDNNVTVFARYRLPNLRYFTLVTTVKCNKFKLNLPDHILYSVNVDVLNLKNQLGDWRVRYSIATADSFLKKINYVHFNRDCIKVTDGHKYLNFHLRGAITIVCKRILELKYANQFLF